MRPVSGCRAASARAAAAGRLRDARKDLEQRALARAVAADDTCTAPNAVRCKCADDLAGLDLEGDVLERPEIFGLRIVDFGLRIGTAKSIRNPQCPELRGTLSEIASGRPALSEAEVVSWRCCRAPL